MVRTIETNIRVNYKTTLGDTFDDEDMTEEEIQGMIEQHIQDYADEHNIDIADIEVIN